MFNVFEWFVLILTCNSSVGIVLSDERRQNYGRGFVDCKLVKAPLVFLLLEALLCWFFGDFRCDVSLFIVILV